jgi:hypothetical protein
MAPSARRPATKGPSTLAWNHSPKRCESVSARQTLERGARSTMLFWIRSVLLGVVAVVLVLMTASWKIGNLTVALY